MTCTLTSPMERPVQELEQRIRKELEENPVLDDDAPESKDEDGDEQPRDVSLSEIKDDDSIPEYKLHVNKKPDLKRCIGKAYTLSP